MNFKVNKNLLFILPISIFILWGFASEFDSLEELIGEDKLIKATDELLKKTIGDPNHLPSKKHLARIYLKRGLYLKAENEINYLLALSQSTDHLYLLAQLHLFKDALDSCENVCYQMLARDRSYLPGLLLLARVHALKKHYDLADSTYQDISLIYPNNRDFLIQHSLYLIRLNRLTEADKNIRTLNKIFGQYHGVLYILSLYHFKQKKTTLALNFIRKALFYQPSHPDYQQLLLDIHIENKNYPAVIKWLEERQSQGDDWLYLKLAYYRFKQANPMGFEIDSPVYEKVLVYLQRSLEKNSHNEYVRFFIEYLVLANTPFNHVHRVPLANYHQNRGDFLESRGQHDLANYRYLRALKLNPESVTIRQSYANFLKQVNRWHDYYAQLEIIRNFTPGESFELSTEIDIVNRRLKNTLAIKEVIDINTLKLNRKKIAIFTNIKVVGEELLYAEKNILSFTRDFLKCSKQFDTVPFSSNSDYYLTMHFKYQPNVSIEFEIYDTLTKLAVTNGRFIQKGEYALVNILSALKGFLEEFIPLKGQIIKKSAIKFIIDLGTINHLRTGQQVKIMNRTDPLKNYLANIQEIDDYVSEIELIDDRDAYFIQSGDIVFLTNSLTNQ